MALNVKLVINAIDRATAPIRKINAAISGIRRNIDAAKLNVALSRVRSSVNGVTSAFGGLLAKTAIVGGAAAWGIKTQLIDTGAKFERFRAQLTNLEGSSAGAQKAMDWISDFAARTPYELDEVVDAFIKLKGYGIEPTMGMLKSLGDAAAGRQQPMANAVDMLGDAIMGENERLKNFLVSASIQGDKIVYTWSAHGKQMRAIADKNSQAQIAAVLRAIFNEKYAGQMDLLSKTWDGIWSNLMDTVTRFTQMINDNGVFAYLKTRLQEVLDQANALAADGTLDRWAKQVSNALVSTFEALGKVLPDVWQGMQTFGRAVGAVVEFMGGWKVAAGLMAAVIAGPLLGALVSLGIAIASVGAALWASGITPIVLGITAIAGAAYLIKEHWSEIVDWISSTFSGAVQGAMDKITGIFSGAWDFIGDIADKIKSAASWVTGFYSSGATGGVAGQVGAGASGAIIASGGPFQRGGDMSGRLEIRIDSQGRASVGKVETNNLDLNIDRGWSMVGP